MTDQKNINCVGIIMDGNRRWARERGLPTVEGHRQGYEALKKVLEWGKQEDIPHTVVYGFSTENWNRKEEEVSYLMDLLRNVLSGEELEDIIKRGGRLKIIGERTRFPEDIQQLMRGAEEKTKDGTYTLWLALSYGGRAEILAATNHLITKGKKVREEDFSNTLWTRGMPDPDIIIRTSGEKRLSGFLPWQGVYSELFFIDTYWPDFSKEDFQNILNEYRERERRHGK